MTYSGPLRSLVPNVAIRFSIRATEFFKPVAPCACFGRGKGVSDSLRRHPLIKSDFSPAKCARVSMSLAGQNLHLVVRLMVA